MNRRRLLRSATALARAEYSSDVQMVRENAIKNHVGGVGNNEPPKCVPT